MWCCLDPLFQLTHFMLLLDILHPVCSCLLKCIFGVNIPAVGMQKLRPKSSWKALKHTLLPLAFLVLFPLGALTCTWNYFVCPLQSGTWFSRVDVGWTAALTQAAVAASFPARPLISVLCGAFLLCCWVFAFLLPSLGGRGRVVSVCPSTSRKAQNEKAMAGKAHRHSAQWTEEEV